MAVLLIKGNGKNALFHTTITAKTHQFQEIEGIVASCINLNNLHTPHTIEIKDYLDSYQRTLWTYTPTVKSIHHNGVLCVSIAHTIEHHTKELIAFLEGLREEGIEHRRDCLYAERQSL